MSVNGSSYYLIVYSLGDPLLLLFGLSFNYFLSLVDGNTGIYGNLAGF